MKIGNLPAEEFRIMTVEMSQNRGKRMEAENKKTQERFTKDLQELKNKQTEINNTLEGINSRITEAEEWMNSDLENRRVEITATEQNIEKRMKRNKDCLRDLWDNIQHTNILIIWVPEEERKDLRKYLKR